MFCGVWVLVESRMFCARYNKQLGIEMDFSIFFIINENK